MKKLISCGFNLDAACGNFATLKGRQYQSDVLR